jgi:hypothetical protein
MLVKSLLLAGNERNAGDPVTAKEGLKMETGPRRHKHNEDCVLERKVKKKNETMLIVKVKMFNKAQRKNKTESKKRRIEERTVSPCVQSSGETIV